MSLYKALDIPYRNERIAFELKIGKKQNCNVKTIKSIKDDFETFTGNLELSLDKIFDDNPSLVVAWKFNAKSDQWYKNDKTTHESSKIENLTSQFGLKQIINYPTHILCNSFSCNDLHLKLQPNLVMESSVHPSLHPNCDNQIGHAKFNWKIFYPPSTNVKFIIIKKQTWT